MLRQAAYDVTDATDRDAVEAIIIRAAEWGNQ
jgi:hypothetical protein